MQAIIAGCAEGHQALLTFQGRLQNTTVLAGNLQVAEIPMEQHVGLLEQQPIDRGLCAQRQKICTASFQDLQISLRQGMFYRVVVILCVVEVDDV
jgi:hypothetical protein